MQLTFSDAMDSPKRENRSPSVRFFYDHVDVRELFVVRPSGRSLATNNRVDLVLGPVFG
jgi:hypothetical protein